MSAHTAAVIDRNGSIHIWILAAECWLAPVLLLQLKNSGCTASCLAMLRAPQNDRQKLRYAGYRYADLQNEISQSKV